MKSMKGRRFWNGIAFRIVMIFFALLIPIYALLIISARAYIAALEKQALANSQSILDVNLAELDSEIQRLDRYLYDFTENNPNYLRLLRWEDSDWDELAYYGVNRKLLEQNLLSSFSEAFFLYIEAPDRFLLIHQQIGIRERNELQRELQDSYYIRENLAWNIHTINEVPYLLHTVGYSGVYLGTMVDMNAFLDKIRLEVPYKEAEVSLEHVLDINQKASKLSVSREVHDTKQILTISLNRSEVTRGMPLISRIILIIGLVLLLVLPPMLLIAFMRMIVRPIRNIEKGMFELASGDQDYRIPDFQASQEFVGMKNSFNNMASEIQTLKIRSYEEQLEREQMQLQNLLLQIRPHFLLNFFNQIFSMAELEDYTGIKKSSLYLSRYFRYLFRSDRIATYKSELDLVDAYLELMEERFLDCFIVERDIDESLLSYRIPPLIVQNFVENIIKYAVSEGNIITIRLSLKKEGDRVVMTVQDDGPGMEESVLQQIRELKPIEKNDGTHIGIFNSAYRLKKLCGEQSELQIESVLTEGTTVRIILPEKQKDDSGDKNNKEE